MTKRKEPVKAPVKKAPEKKAPVKKTKPENEVKKIPRVIQPLIIETIRSSEKISDRPVFEKVQYSGLPTVLQAGDVRCIVLKDYKGMLNDLYEGDIIDLPERRYKSLAFRGLVKIYDGKNLPNKER